MQKIALKQKIILIIFGLLLFVVLLEIGLRLGGFVLLSLQEHRNRISLKEQETYRIICLGESTTAWGGKDSYSSQLEEILNQRDTGTKFSVINKGVCGTDTGKIMVQLEDNLDKYSPDMVITMMGINDVKYTIAYENIPVKKTRLFIKSFRTYKLIRLLWQHIINKVKEMRIYGLCRIHIDLKHPRPHDKLGRYYRHQGRYDGVEKMFKRAIETNPKNSEAYSGLGRYYRDQGRYEEAEKMFKRAIETNPKNSEAYSGLGRCYRDQGRYDGAEEMFKKAIEMEPENYNLYVKFGQFYRDQEKYGQAEKMFKKTIEMEPENYYLYVKLGRCYRDQEKYDQAAEMFKKAIEINPKKVKPYIELGWCYKTQEKYDQAEEMYKKAIEMDTENQRLYGLLRILYGRQEKNKSAEEYFRKVNRLRLGTYNITRHNYQRLKEIVTPRGIRLVCVQYPMRDVESLKKMLRPHDGIIFVDNERVFKEALKQAIYKEYFTDNFAGDFGHCTRKGNRLLAKNIADVILKGCFNINE